MLVKDLPIHDSRTRSNIPELVACPGKVLLMNDRISDLPDDILLHIISSLTLKEAGSTSVLSKRWRHVWSYVPHLIFDDKDVDEWMSRLSMKFQKEDEPKYFHWVNQVVSSHMAHTIDDFMVRFGLISRNDHIDRWLRFAMEKKVKRLQLDMVLSISPYYTFPSLTPWKTLTSLVLRLVNVTGETLQKFLSDCQNLEFLSVSLSNTLVDLRVVDPPNLKYLEISEGMQSMGNLEISAPNLILFYYCGGKLLTSPLKSTPKLVELYIDGYYGANLLRKKYFSHFSSYISQLEVLALYTKSDCLYIRRAFPVGRKLKTLKFRALPSSSADELFVLRDLVKAFPLLHKLIVVICIDEHVKMAEWVRETYKVFPHRHLKILEISGFKGGDMDMEFATFLIKIFVSLEKIIIRPDYSNMMIDGGGATWREEAERLRAVIQPGTDLEIYDEWTYYKQFHRQGRFQNFLSSRTYT